MSDEIKAPWSPFGTGCRAGVEFFEMFRVLHFSVYFPACGVSYEVAFVGPATHPKQRYLLHVGAPPKVSDVVPHFCVCVVCIFCFISPTPVLFPSCPFFTPPPSSYAQTLPNTPNNIRPIGAASNDPCGPSVRLLRGVKAAGGNDGARRLEALARRLPMERAALEAAAAAGAAEAREWRASVADQAEAVVALGQVGGRGVATKHTAVVVFFEPLLYKDLGDFGDFETSDLSCPFSRGGSRL